MRTVTVQVEEVRRETDLAVLLVIDGGEWWVPRSVVEDGDEPSEGDVEIALEVAEWWASKEGLL